MSTDPVAALPEAASYAARPQAAAPRERSFSPRTAARIAGAMYLLTNATAEGFWFFAGPRLAVAGDAAGTADKILAHATLFRVGIVMDLLTCVGVVVLNLALYELLRPVHASLARLAAFWRLVESSVFAASTVCGFAVLPVLSGAAYLHAFEPRQLQALARLLQGARASGFWVAMLFLALGGGVYCYLLLRSRYIPKVLALSGIAAAALFLPYVLARFLSPAWLTTATATVLALPPVALVLLGLIVVPILSFELTIGVWLLVKGVRIPVGA